MGGGQGGCKRKIEVIVKMPKKKSRGGPVGGSVNCVCVWGGGGCSGRLGGQGICERRIEELKIQKKSRGGEGRGEVRSEVGVRLDVYEELKL